MIKSPLIKSLVLGLGVIVVGICVVFILKPERPGYWQGYLLASNIMTALAAGIYATLTKKDYSWRQMAFIYSVVFTAFTLLQFYGRYRSH